MRERGLERENKRKAKSSSFAGCVLLTGSVSVKEETDAKGNRCREERKGIQINNGRGVIDSDTHTVPLIMSLGPGKEI